MIKRYEIYKISVHKFSENIDTGWFIESDVAFHSANRHFQNENGLIQQLRVSDSSHPIDHDLIIVDAQQPRGGDLSRIEKLFQEGFTIKGDQNIHYIFFSRSKKNLYFLRDERFKQVILRSTCGLQSFAANPSDKPFFWLKNDEKSLKKFYQYKAKWSKYKALSLSDAESLDDIDLQNSAMIVVPDCKIKVFLNDPYWEASEPDQLVTAVFKKTEQMVNAFDGMGIVSPQYAKKMRNMLATSNGLEENPQPSSFQIRLPFIKGVLHEVDFRKFFKEEFFSEKQQPAVIYDIWGTAHPTDRVQIILTESMFKGQPWYTQLLSYLRSFPDDKTVLNSVPKELLLPKKLRTNRFTAWDLYIHFLNVWEHKLAVSGSRPHPQKDWELRQEASVEPDNEFQQTDPPAGPGNDEEFCDEFMNEPETEGGDGITLNSQVLSTVGMDWRDFRKVVEESKSKLIEFSQEDDLQRKYFASFIGRSQYDEKSTYHNMARALELCPSLLNTEVFRKRIKTEIKNRNKNMSRGKLPAKGEIRYLSSDLMSFLRYLAVQTMKNDRTSFKLHKKCFYNNSREVAGRNRTFVLAKHEFFAPNYQTKEEKNVIFRNPHITREEFLLLSSYENLTLRSVRTYQKYFGHLQGVLMMNPISMNFMRLNGADYDGDVVQIIDQLEFINAVENGQIKDWDFLKSQMKLGANIKKSTFHFSPLIVPANVPQGEQVIFQNSTIGYLNMEYSLFKSVSNQQVGEYSLAAMNYSAQAYGFDVNEEIIYAAKRKVLTMSLKIGEEVDSVKTGIKPKIPKDIKLRAERQPFINYVQRLKYNKNISLRSVDGYNNWIRFNLRNLSDDEVIQFTWNLNLLPLYVKTAPPLRTASPLRTVKMILEEAHGLEVSPDVESKWLTEELNDILQRWERKGSNNNYIVRATENRNRGTIKNIREILRNQYGPEKIEDKFAEMISELSKATKESKKNLYEIKHELSEEKLSYRYGNEKKDILEKILCVKRDDFPSLFKVLLNFSEDGFRLPEEVIQYLIEQNVLAGYEYPKERFREEIDKLKTRSGLTDDQFLCCFLNLGINYPEKYMWDLMGHQIVRYIERKSNAE